MRSTVMMKIETYSMEHLYPGENELITCYSIHSHILSAGIILSSLLLSSDCSYVRTRFTECWLNERSLPLMTISDVT